MMAGDSCKTCRFFQDQWEKGDELLGNCCRRAPFPVVYRQTSEELRLFGGGSLWPVVWEKNWCGEHEKVVDINPSAA